MGSHSRRRSSKQSRLQRRATEVIQRARQSAEQGRADEAIRLLQSGLSELGPRADLHCEMGTMLLRADRFAEAAEQLEASLRLEPQYAAAWNNLGLALQHLKIWRQAVDCFQHALRCQPSLHMAHYNLAATFALQGRWDEVLSHLIAAPQIEELPHVARLRALAHQHAGQWREAERYFQQALAADADDHTSLIGLALAQLKQGDADAARETLRAIERRDASTEAAYVRATCLPVIYRDLEHVQSSRATMERELDDLISQQRTIDAATTVLNTTFLAAYQGCDDRRLHENLSRLWKAKNPATVKANAATQGRLRIGFLSCFFKTHTITKLTAGWIKELSRDDFEVIALSPCDHHDEGAERIRQAADRYVLLPGDVSPALAAIADQQLDVLLFPEIGMDAFTSSIARHRLAPVQCTTWGHPVTTGMPTIDYFISSRLIEVAGAEQHYTERLVLLDTLPAYYYHPPGADQTKHRRDWQLTDECHLYACPHALFKMHPAFDEALAGILRSDPLAVIALIDPGHTRATEQLRARLARHLGNDAERIRFLPLMKQTEYLRLLETSQVLLDSFPFGGGNTHYEAVSVGLPIVTLPTQLMRGRVGLGVYQKLGLDELIARDLEHYVQLAVETARDPARQQQFRDLIQARKSRLFEDSDSVRELEQFLLTACGRRSRTIQKEAAQQATGGQQLGHTPKPAQTAPLPVTSNVLRQATCPACGHHVAVPFFNPGDLPLATLAWPSSRQEALDMPRLPHDFVRCVDCGHIYNARFEYGHVPYSAKPNLMFNRGALWKEHLQNVSRLLVEQLPPNPIVVEIGCGDGHMLRALAALRPDGRYIGFDPNGAIDTGHGAIEARRDLFDAAKHIEACRPDLLISRHVLEHLMNPLGFVQALEFAVSYNGHPTRLFIEVPCVDHVLNLRRTVDFYYEHNSHFTTHSLRRMLERCAGRIELLQTAYGEEVAFALAAFQPRQQQVQLARESLQFRAACRELHVAIRQQLNELAASGKRIAIWGGTGKAAAFIQQHGIDDQRFPLVVDSDADKAGTFVPGAGQQIQRSDALLSQPVDVIIIATSWRAADIVLEMERCGIRCPTVLIELEGRLVDYHREAHPYRLATMSPSTARTLRRDAANAAAPLSPLPHDTCPSDIQARSASEG